MNMESPNFFSEGLMKEPLSADDLKHIATLTQSSETKGFYDEGSEKIFFTDKGVSTAFVFDEDAQRFVIEHTHDLMTDPDAHTHQVSRPLESADDINQARAVALHEALAELRNPDVIEE
jgi:hypothetical protein